MSKVYIIIVNWNGWKDTIECLESLMLLAYPNFRIVVCDNGSSDCSVSELRLWGQTKSCGNEFALQELDRAAAEIGGIGRDITFTLITLNNNIGFGAASNVGMQYALACGDADYCWLLNNDTVVDSLALIKLVETLDKKTDAGMCGSTLRHYDDPARIQALGGAIYYKWFGFAWHIGRTLRGYDLPDAESVEKCLDYIVGASILVRSAFIRDVGLLAEDYFLYFEEVDWAYRGHGRYRLAYAPQSLVFHKIGASIGSATNPRNKSVVCDYYSLRNRIIFTRRYCPEALICVYSVLLLELVARILCGRWDLAGMLFRLLLNRSIDPVANLGHNGACF